MKRMTARAGAGPQAALASTGSPPAILVVDDDELSRLLIDAALETLRLVNPRWHAKDGEEACAMLESCASGEFPVPALVMLDSQMPSKSGLEVLLWMREQPGLAKVPVVMLTAVSDVESIRRAYDSGAASYLVKPVAFQALTDVLRALPAPWMLL